MPSSAPLASRVTAAARTLRPQAGALANARDAVRVQQAAEQDRRAAALDLARRSGSRSWTPLRPPADAAPHGVCFYDSTADLVERALAFVGEGLLEDELCLVVAAAEHRARLQQRLHATGLAGAGELLGYEADHVRSLLHRGGGIDVERFERQVADVLRAHVTAGRRVRVYGEVAGLLWVAGEVVAAQQLERMWEELQQELGFPVLCAYPLSELQGEVDDGGSGICGLHSHLAGAAA